MGMKVASPIRVPSIYGELAWDDVTFWTRFKNLQKERFPRKV